MFFSIIIPVYNVENYLYESVNSVLQQGEKDIEILLIDDGSTDSSGKICDMFQSEFPDIIRVIHKNNEGLLLTRRRGIQESKGEWLIHLDSDDYMLPGVLRTVRETIDKYNPDLIIGKIAYGAEDGENIAFCSKISFYDGQVFEESDKELLYKHFFLDGYISSMCQKIARNDIVDKNKDYSQWSRVSVAEDVLQSLPILYNSKKCVFIDKTLIYYRYNAKSITKEKSASSHLKSIYSLLDVIEEERKFFMLLNMSEVMIAAIASKHCILLCKQIRQLSRCDTGEFVRQLITGLENNDTWRWLFISADKPTLGRFCKVCYFLISNRMTFLLHLLCRVF